MSGYVEPKRLRERNAKIIEARDQGASVMMLMKLFELSSTRIYYIISRK